MSSKFVQVRCLNDACGGYSTKDTTVHFNLRRHRPAWNPFGLGCLASVLLLFVSAWPLAPLLAFLIAGPPTNGGAWTATVQQEAIDMALVVWVVVSLMLLLWFTGRYNHFPELHQYECTLCGKKWNWLEGTPKPQEPEYRPTGVAQRGLERNQQAAAAYEFERRKREGRA